MSVNRTDSDVAGEYLHELDLRLSGLPLLQRRELLADLSAHIEAARAGGATSEGELIDVLERLGTPEVIAAAAYEEAGARPVAPPPMPPPMPPPAAPRPIKRASGVPGWAIALVAGFAAIFLIGCIGLAAFSTQGASAPESAVSVVEPAEAGPVEPAPAPTFGR